MYDLITIGDITVDLYLKGSDLTEEHGRFQLAVGGKYVVDYFHESIGGGGANVAIAASVCGLDTASCALIGENAFKHLILQGLTRKSVSTELVMYEKDFMNISSIILSQTGEKAVIHYPGKIASFLAKIQPIASDLKGRGVYIGNLPTVSISEKIAIARIVRPLNEKIFLNLGTFTTEQGYSSCRELLDLGDALIINTHEYAELVGKGYAEIDFHSDCAKAVGYENKLLVLTDGKNGSYTYQNGEVFYHKSASIPKVVDSTGAGDAYAGVFIASYLQGIDIKKCMELATEYAGKIVGKVGAN